MEQVMRFFGLSREAVCQRLQDVLQTPAVTAVLTAQDEDVLLRLSCEDAAVLQQTADEVAERMNVYLYNRQDAGLAARVVELLGQKNMTLALAESCTGGLIASSLTDVPGCSRVFGTGVVSYSCDCKERLLHVRRDTLRRYGAVSDKTAAEMAQGVRRAGNARLGLSITGEAGPTPAEDHPVGTVFACLTDGRRSWVQRWQLDNGVRDRGGIRRAAALRALDMVRRYLEAYPAVMAGGILRAEEPPKRRFHRPHLANLFPHRGEGVRRNLIKILCWALIVCLFIAAGMMVYQLSRQPDTNRRLQDSLRGLYWSETVDGLPVTDTADGRYPEGMMLRFRGLYDINADIGGWIRIPDTVVDYPVVTDRDGYYVNHSFTGEYSYYGQPYFSRRTTADSTLAQTYVVYGNNTQDEQMFSTLLSYRRIAFLREHAVVELSTLYRASKWQIFAVMVMDEEELPELEHVTGQADDLQRMGERSLFTADVRVTAQDTILLLVTDASEEYGRRGAQLVIAAVECAAEPSEATYAVNWDVRMPAGWTTATRATTTTATRATTTTTTRKQAVATTTVPKTTTSTTTVPTTTTTATTTTTTTTTAATTTATTTTTTAEDTSDDSVDDTITEETEKDEDADIRD